MCGDLAWKPILGGGGPRRWLARPPATSRASMGKVKVASVWVALVFAATLLAACGQAPPPVDGAGSLPSKAPPATIMANGACILAGSKGAPTSNGSRTTLEVRTNPRFARVIWVPGLNARPCRAVLSRLGRGEADALATAIDAAPLFPTGTIACPNDDGGAADVYFSYRTAPSVARVWISLAGCRPIAAMDRWPRKLDSSVMDLLRSGAPRAWRHYLGD